VAVKKAIVDANVLLALIDKKDKWHPEAKILAETLKKRKWEVIYLDCVLNEVISVLVKRLEDRKESQSLVSLLESLENLVSFDTDFDEVDWVVRIGREGQIK
jgi:predicted nucleic acid-binding protein